jgi:chemotaxis protein MotA
MGSFCRVRRILPTVGAARGRGGAPRGWHRRCIAGMPFSRLAHLGPAGTVALASLGVAAAAAAAGLLDPLSLLVTVGGTLAVTRLTFSRVRLASAWRHVGEALHDETDTETVIADLKRLALAQRVGGVPELERAAAGIADPFLGRAADALLEATDAAELEATLTGEVRARLAEGEAARHVMLTLGKLFPAFGLIGTLLGLVSLLRGLDGADLVTMSGALGHAVLTTLYGAVLANVLALPLATKLQAHNGRRAVVMDMIVAGAVLVHRAEYPSAVERVLRAYAGEPLPERHAPTQIERPRPALARRAA